MTKSYLVIGAIVIVLLLGAYLMKPQKSTQMVQPPAEQSVATAQPTSGETGTMKKAAAVVTYTDNGFVPNPVTIKKGETVKWDNESSEQMWVASDPHPIHTDYPGFDELTSIRKGGSYLFTFDKAGS